MKGRRGEEVKPFILSQSAASFDLERFANERTANLLWSAVTGYRFDFANDPLSGRQVPAIRMPIKSCDLAPHSKIRFAIASIHSIANCYKLARQQFVRRRLRPSHLFTPSPLLPFSPSGYRSIEPVNLFICLFHHRLKKTKAFLR